MATPPNNQHTQQQQILQPIILQTQNPNFQKPIDIKEIVVKSLWKKSEKSYEGAFRSKNEGDLIWEADNLLKEIRKDLDSLRLVNKSIVMATFIDIKYSDKEADYQKIQEQINELSRQEASANVVNELKIISHQLDLDISNIDVIFPQIVYSSVHMRRLMEIAVKQIGYPEIKEEAEVAYTSLLSIEPHLKLEQLNQVDENDSNPIEIAMRTITLLNEMQKFKAEILQLKKQDIIKKEDTRKFVLLGMFSTLLFLSLVIFGLRYNEVRWDDIRNYPILGIPLGIGIWSFIGSFAAMMQQFYQKSIYEFGDTFKWILIRPVLGVLMGSAIYLAFSNGFGIDDNTGNGTLMYLVAFLVGLSDSFAVGIIDRLQGAISNTINGSNYDKPEDNFNNNSNNTLQPSYIYTPSNIPVTTINTDITEKPLVEKVIDEEPIVEKIINKKPIIIENPITIIKENLENDLNKGEDEK